MRLKYKISIGLLFLLFTAFSINTTEENRGLAKVEKVEGKEVYLFSEPLTTYKVIEDYDNSKNVIQSCNLRNLVESYIKRGKRDKINFDALYMNTEDNIYLIKFIKDPEGN